MIKCFYQEKEGVNMKIRKLTVSIFAVILAFLILPLSSYAEQTRPTIPKKQTTQKSSQTPTESNNTQKPTEKRHLIEYTELTMKRFLEFDNKYKKGYDITVVPNFGTVTETEDEYSFYSTFGLISVDKKEFYVSEVIMTLSDKDSDSSTIERNVFKCISSMSAL